jgi:DNA-binding NarL/FixJ family response regulator
MTRPRVLIADDHRILRDGLRPLLCSDHDVVGEVGDGAALVEQAVALDPDVLLVDITMPVLSGIEAVRRLRELGHRARAIFLTMHDDASYASRALAAGGHGYVLKHAAAAELVEAIKTVLQGGRFISPLLHGDIDDAGDATDDGAQRSREAVSLSPRQREVLRMIVEGFRAREIGERLGISSRTVETHKYRIMDMLGVTTTAALIQRALQDDLVPALRFRP